MVPHDDATMDATKPCEFIGFGAMDATKPYEFIGFGAMDATSHMPVGPGRKKNGSTIKPGPLVTAPGQTLAESRPKTETKIYISAPQYKSYSDYLFNAVFTIRMHGPEAHARTQLRCQAFDYLWAGTAPQRLKPK
jgi:hypothetical protein